MIELRREYLSVRCIWHYVTIMSWTSFRVNTHSIVCVNIKRLCARGRCHIWRKQRYLNPQSHCTFRNTQPVNQNGEMIELCCEFLSVRCILLYVIILSCTSLRVNPHSIVCLNTKELPAWSRCHTCSLSECNEIWTHNHLIRKRTLNHLVKLAKWLRCVVST